MLVDGGTEDERTIVGEHFNYLKKLTEDGTAILMGRTQETVEDTIGIVVFVAPSLTEAQRLMNNDPAVLNGIMSAQLFNFNIALFNPDAVDQQD